MARLHPQTWGDRQQIDIKDDWSLLTEEERRRKADELIAMIRELREPPPQPPPLVYRPEEASDNEPSATGEIGSRAHRDERRPCEGSARSGGLQTVRLGSSEVP